MLGLSGDVVDAFEDEAIRRDPVGLKKTQAILAADIAGHRVDLEGLVLAIDVIGILVIDVRDGPEGVDMADEGAFLRLEAHPGQGG